MEDFLYPRVSEYWLSQDIMICVHYSFENTTMVHVMYHGDEYKFCSLQIWMIPVRLLWFLAGLTVHVGGQQQDGDCPPPVGKFLSLNGWRYEDNREIKFQLFWFFVMIFDNSFFDSWFLMLLLRYENNREIKFHILIFDYDIWCVIFWFLIFNFIVGIREQPRDQVSYFESLWWFLMFHILM